MRKYPEEVRQKVFDLIKNGMPKMEASRKFGISYRTITDWTFGIRLRKTYPKSLRKQVRSLVGKGLQKSEVARVTGIPYATVTNYTRDMNPVGSGHERIGYERIAGATLKLLRELVTKGYVFDENRTVDRSCYHSYRV
jgi:transposase